MTAAKIPVAAVVGPTATGKTELGIQLCQRLGGEIVSCDSMQVYKGLPIGTAQPTAEELAAAPHHLIGFLDVEQPFSVSDYVDAAGQVIREISGRGKLPILVGGTGLYARSLLRGFSFEELGLHRIDANIMPHNIASLGVVRRCGFVEEGLARKYLKINGVWEDHLHMVKLNED